MTIPRLAHLLTFLTLGAASWAGAERPPVFDEGRFELQVLIEPLTQPMQFEVAPDGKIYLIELGGALKRFDPATHHLTILATLDVFAEQENGLIGLALDPHFQQNHWLYLQYSPKSFSGQHVSRFTVVGDKLDLNSEKLLLKYEDQRRECCHHAGSMRFDAAGNLYISSGDNTNPGMSDGYSPLDERKDHFPRDSQKSASNTADLRGKILRIHPNPDGTASIPEGNLFPKDGSEGRPEIYVMGCRNPWRISVDTKTGILYWGEVGPDAGGDSARGPRGYDEINQARKPGNFGWPYFVANNRPYARFDFEKNRIGDKYDPAHPVNHSPNNTGRVDLPPAEPAWIYYPYGHSEEFPELDAEGGRTACAGPVFHVDPAIRTANRFPDYYENCLFIFDWSRHWIKAVRLDAESNLVKIEPFLPRMKFKRPIDMRFGPDGALYLLEYGETWGVNKDSRLSRVDYVRGNRPPVARATATNNVGKEPLKVRFSSNGTFDRDGDALTYAWHLVTQRGEVSFSTNPDASYEFKKPGSYNVKLTVTDTHGATSIATVAVLVGNTPPRVTFRAPLDGDFFDWGKPVVYHVAVDDAEDGDSDDHALDMSPRVTVQAEFRHVRPEDAMAEKRPDPSDDPPPLRLIKSADCFNCHAFDHRVIGPSFEEIASKYHNDPKSLDASVHRVINGSSGVWGQLAMLPHAQHTPEQVRQMVSWVYSIDGKSSGRAIAKGLDGDIAPGPAPRGHGYDSGTLVLEAAYQDNGAAGLPPITGTTRVTLRTRKVEAEHASQIHGAKVLEGGNASGGRFVGAIDDGYYLKFDQVNLKGIARVTFHVASAGSGGNIELCLDSPAGPVLGSVAAPVTGGWENWTDVEMPIVATPTKHNVIVRFTNAEHHGGLMNLDWLRFDKGHPR